MLNFYNMIGNYSSRLVANNTINNAIIDTVLVMDSKQPYETGIKHPNYNNGNWVIVELYMTREKAEEGHIKWCDKFSNVDNLPESLDDVNETSLRDLILTSVGYDIRKTYNKK